MIGFLRRHPILRASFILLLLLVLSGTALLGWRMRGPYRDYRLDTAMASHAMEGPGTFHAGAAKRDITPDLDAYDTWTDVSGTNRYEPARGDTYEDRTGSGRFDPVWLGGFNYARAATGVNDPLWVRAIAVRNNGVTVVLVSIDSVGIFHDRFITVRNTLDPTLEIGHVLFSSTHTHSAPDTMGLWSYRYILNRLDEAYIEHVQAMCVEAIEEAVRNLEPAAAIHARVEIEPEGHVRDTREPIVYDRILGAVQFVGETSGETIATMFSWGNHPEALDANNTVITSDFPHYWREGVENGVADPHGVEGLGGVAVFFQGMCGGLMTPLNLEVTHRSGAYTVSENSVEKAEILGENLAILTVNALRGGAAVRVDNPGVAFAARTVFVPVETHFRWAIMLGVLHPGWFWGYARTEVNAIRIGDVELLSTPGELYPEIGDGGVEAPEGGDFPGPPREVPPLRERMGGELNLIIGLANDAIGYIIPKTQWDTEPPHAYGRTSPPYGEVNSAGPNAAPALHEASLDLLGRLHGVIGGE